MSSTETVQTLLQSQRGSLLRRLRVPTVKGTIMLYEIAAIVDRRLRKLFPGVSIDVTHGSWHDTLRVTVKVHPTKRIYAGQLSICKGFGEDPHDDTDILATNLVFDVLRYMATEH